jgi:hypothetical protein
MKFLSCLLLNICGLLPLGHVAGILAADGLERPWNAQWIAAPGDTGSTYGVFYFGKSIHLADKPQQFIIHVSADNRYKLFPLARRGATLIIGIMKLLILPPIFLPGKIKWSRLSGMRLSTVRKHR